MFLVTCPHCKEYVLILQENCGIFRHAALKSTGEQIDPHTPQAECERLVREGLIIGCGRPFRIRLSGAVPCDYI